MSEYTELNKVASQVRRDIVRMVHGAKGGHPGGALGCTDLLVLLYFKMMKHDKNFKMDGIGEDIFYLSNIFPSLVIIIMHTILMKCEWTLMDNLF